MVKDIHLGSWSSEPEKFANVNGTLFFSADDGIHNRELWKSDGTEEGTVMVKDIYQGSFEKWEHRPYDLVEYRGVLFFTVEDDEHGLELWTSDGSESGTVMVKDTYPGPYGSNPGDLTVYKDRLFFRAYEESTALQLWVSDGTEGGTTLFKDLSADGDPFASPGGLAVLGDTLYFTTDFHTTDHSIWRRELWKSDGTPEETVQVSNINLTYTAIRETPRFAFANGLVFFVARDEAHGEELWATDGTEAGTQLVIDLYPGDPNRGENGPRILGTIGDAADGPEIFLFAGDDYLHGQELWKVAPPGFALVGPIRAFDGKFSFTFEATMGNTYRIERSPDLTDWSLWDSFNDREGEIVVEDADAIDADRFFYRVLETEAP